MVVVDNIAYRCLGSYYGWVMHHGVDEQAVDEAMARGKVVVENGELSGRLITDGGSIELGELNQLVQRKNALILGMVPEDFIGDRICVNPHHSGFPRVTREMHHMLTERGRCTSTPGGQCCLELE
ncbi:hypothetical protein BGX38DRAFT_1144705 [Terfezia claveryi]|nr:hypothetical protein BGX38DRAFT_1144705 [Terfezia claveryi]